MYSKILTDKSLHTEGAVRRQVSILEENKEKYFKFNYCKFCAKVLNFEIFSKFCLFINVASCCLNFNFFYNF